MPQAALLAVPDAPPRFFAHRARSAPVPQGALVCEPSQVQCCTFADHGPGAHSPGRSAMASLRPPDAAMASPIQVQCCTLADHSPENRPSLRIPKRNRPHICGACFVLESNRVLRARAVNGQRARLYLARFANRRAQWDRSRARPVGEEARRSVGNCKECRMRHDYAGSPDR